MGEASGKTTDLKDVGEAIVAVIVSTLAAGFAAMLGVIASMFLGYFLLRLGLMTDEGASWSGISLGIPIGFVCAVIAFVYSFRKIRAYGKSD
jgi:hypothetical protein